MTNKFDLSTILFFLELIKKYKKKINQHDFKYLFMSVDDYEEMKRIEIALIELKIKLPYQVYNFIVHFMNDYDEVDILRKDMLKIALKKKNVFSPIFYHQLCLAKTPEEAKEIVLEARGNGINLGDYWLTNYNNFQRIIETKKEIKKLMESEGWVKVGDKLYESFNELKNRYFNELSIKSLKEIILKSKNITITTRKAQINIHNRKQYIREFANKIANGICQLCEKVAPFTDKYGKPFLEVHHIQYLSKGGKDELENVVALCPNCHRRVHHLELEEEVEKLSQIALRNINNNLLNEQ